ncbi:MAG: branched-chain amino acid ABC transporter permease [Nitrososphaerales archaeon]|jgi:branched-chain amino acid transport system permease protein
MRPGKLAHRPGTYALILLSLGVSASFPLIETNQYLIYVGIYALFTVIYALSWNLLAFSGQASFGHAGFLGIGAYTSALLVIAGVPIPVGVLAGGLTSALVGIVIGALSLRLTNRVAMGLVTYGFTVVAEALAIVFSSVTAGYQGLEVPLFSASFTGQYYSVLAIAILTTAAISAVLVSPLGLNLAAIREDELAASVVGINVQRHKLFVFVLSAFFAGVAGAAYVHFIGYVDVDVFALNNNLIPIVATLLGGVNTIAGPIVGAIFFSYLTEATGIFSTQVQYELIGAILIAVVLVAPIGLVPSLARIARKAAARHRSTTRTGGSA